MALPCTTPIETGLSMAMAADGGRGQILGGGEGFGLAFKADTLWVGMRTKAASGPGGNLDSSTAGVSRLPTALGGSQSMTIASRMGRTPAYRRTEHGCSYSLSTMRRDVYQDRTPSGLYWACRPF